MQNVLTPAQMATAEKNSVEHGVSLWELMQNAGYVLFEEVKSILYKNQKNTALILCGNGNNAGDGFVCAELLSESGIAVDVCMLCGNAKTELAIKAKGLMSENVNEISAEEIKNREYGVCVDCVFGTGFKGKLSEDIAKAFKGVRAEYTVACDMPSGVNSKNGEADENTLKCDLTVTFHKTKIGCLLPPANEYTGEIKTADIKIPKAADVTGFDVTDDGFVQKNLPKRFEHSHKGSYGKVMCICGSLSYSGAAVMSVKAALRCGVGLACLCSTADVVKISASHMCEAIYLPINADENGFVDPSDEQLEKIVSEAKRYDCVLLGCGIGKGSGAMKILKAILESYEKTIVIDADGINLISTSINMLMNTKASLILTPHAAELARLCGIEINEAVQNRFESAQEIAAKYNAVVVAKGAKTAVIGCDKAYLSLTGNSGLSKGGSGDMLAGMISSFAAQGKNALESAALGTYLHGKAADITAEQISKRGMLASDILDTMPLMFSD